MSDRDWTRVVGVVSALPVASLVAVVVGVAVVAMYAEARRAWEAYLLMERAMAVAAAVTGPLLGAGLVAGFGVVYLAPRFER